MNRNERFLDEPSLPRRDPSGSLPGHGGQEHELQVLQAIRGTTFGTIEVTVHHSRIVQITRSEKIRF